MMDSHPTLIDAPFARDDEPSLSILVVDDDMMVREVTAMMLADAGHAVYEASDGAEALACLAHETRVDLLITDINMPGMNGLELADTALARWPSLQILLVSGRPQPASTRPFMTKPFGCGALLAAVARVTPPWRPPPERTSSISRAPP